MRPCSPGSELLLLDVADAGADIMEGRAGARTARSPASLLSAAYGEQKGLSSEHAGRILRARVAADGNQRAGRWKPLRKDTGRVTRAAQVRVVWGEKGELEGGAGGPRKNIGVPTSIREQEGDATKALVHRRTYRAAWRREGVCGADAACRICAGSTRK